MILLTVYLKLTDCFNHSGPDASLTMASEFLSEMVRIRTEEIKETTGIHVDAAPMKTEDYKKVLGKKSEKFFRELSFSTSSVTAFSLRQNDFLFHQIQQ